jgi:FkbM family methyltransferase
MINHLQQQFGLWRSLLIYRGIPFRKRRLVNFYRQFIPSGALCFDVGSHVGNRLDAWSSLEARIVAVEPQPIFMRFLQSRYGQRKNITLIQKAVGASAGKATLFVSTRTPTVTSLSRSWISKVKQDKSFKNVQWDEELEVDVTTLDQLISDHGPPILCKIDVEGYEHQVLQGLSYPVRAISFEYIPVAWASAQNCILELQRIGSYKFNWSIGENYRLESETWVSAESMLELVAAKLRFGRSGDIYAHLEAD